MISKFMGSFFYFELWVVFVKGIWSAKMINKIYTISLDNPNLYA